MDGFLNSVPYGQVSDLSNPLIILITTYTLLQITGQAMSLQVEEVLFKGKSEYQDVIVFKSKVGLN
jgi:spermidine synthase